METTLNMRADISARISQAAYLKGMSRSDLVVFLIKKVMDDVSDPGRIGKMVHYQKRRRPAEWHTFHVYLQEDEYEYFLDLRKLLKMSVSLILAYAVNKFLDKILLSKGTDNNRYQNYVLMKDVIDDIICWRFIWGFPHNIQKLILSEQSL